MNETPPGFLVTIRSQPKHGVLYAATVQHGGLKGLSEATGISISSLHKWVNLRGYPRSAFPISTKYFNQERRDKIDAGLRKVSGCGIEECWPPEVREFIEKTKELKSLIFEQTEEVPFARLTGCVMSQLTVDMDVGKAAEQDELKQRMGEVLNTLSYREREIMKMRYGFGDSPPFTLEETAHVLKVGRERIRQIEAKALRKLQQDSRSDKLTGFID